MNPIALVNFTTKVGPWLGRLVGSNAKLLPALLAKLKVGGQFVGRSIDDIVRWARANPANATFLALTLAQLGHSVAGLLGGSNDEEVAQFQKGIDSIAAKAMLTIDTIGEQSEKAGFGGATESRKVQDEVSIETLSWARGFFGGVSQAVQAHRMLQAFVEMPLKEVQHGFSVYKLR